MLRLGSKGEGHSSGRGYALSSNLYLCYKYLNFNIDFGYHPRSLCCNETVILRCMEKQGIETQD